MSISIRSFSLFVFNSLAALLGALLGACGGIFAGYFFILLMGWINSKTDFSVVGLAISALLGCVVPLAFSFLWAEHTKERTNPFVPTVKSTTIQVAICVVVFPLAAIGGASAITFATKKSVVDSTPFGRFGDILFWTLLGLSAVASSISLAIAFFRWSNQGLLSSMLSFLRTAGLTLLLVLPISIYLFRVYDKLRTWDAMQNVLLKESEFENKLLNTYTAHLKTKLRDKVPNRSVSEFANDLDNIDLGRCPAPFKNSWHSHVSAWKSLGLRVERNPSFGPFFVAPIDFMSLMENLTGTAPDDARTIKKTQAELNAIIVQYGNQLLNPFTRW